MTSPNVNAADALLVRAAQAKVLGSDPTSVITLLADADATGGRLTSNRTLFQPGAAGAPPHYHGGGAELFFILDGALQMLLGERIVTVNKDDIVAVPPHLNHAFAPAPDSGADVLIDFAPGTERFESLPASRPLYRGEASPQEILDTQEPFDNYYVESSTWEQARAGEGARS